MELIEQAKEGTLEDEEGNTLPALISVYEDADIRVTDWLSNNRNLTKRKAPKARTHDELGYRKGVQQGDKIGLHRAVQKENKPKLIGR